MATAQQIARLRKATGLGWMGARLFLLQKPSMLCERIILAKETQKTQTLHDPIEDDPNLVLVFVDVWAKAEEAFSKLLSVRNEKYRSKGLDRMIQQRPRGACHFIWKEMKRELLEKYQIEWFSPQEMNPGHIFD